MNPRLLTAVLLACTGLAGGSVRADEDLNLYSWSLVAPVVVSGTSLGENGKVVELEVEHVFRGDVVPGEMILVDQRKANRERNRYLDPKALRLDAGSRFALILEPAYRRGKDGPVVYALTRGVHGARELPQEGSEAWLATLQRLTEIQNLGDENRIWSRLTALLEETDPALLEVALDEFLKFHRGEPQLLLTVYPLMDHPSPRIRELAVRLTGQIVELNPGAEIPERASVRAELIARARRDRSPQVREGAAGALASFPGPDVVDILEEIANDDPEQNVRYAAELVLIELRRAGHEGRRYDESAN
jgi:hypothetical protein